MDEFQSVMEEESEDTHLCGIYTLVWARWQNAVPGSNSFFYFYWKRYDLWKLRIFQATLIWGMFSCFPLKFLQRCSSVMLPADQSTGSEEPGASFPGAGSTACVPEGEDAVSPSPDCSWCSVPHPGGCHPLQCRCRRCRAHTVMLVSLWCASLLEGLGGHRAECEPLLWWEGGGEESGREAELQTWWDCISTHSDLLVSHGAPPCTLTCWFPTVWIPIVSHCSRWGFQVGPSPHTLGVHVSSLEFSMTFFLSSLVPKIASSDVQSAIWYQRCELSTQTNWQRRSWLTSLEKVFRRLLLHESASRLNSRWQ